MSVRVKPLEWGSIADFRHRPAIVWTARTGVGVYRYEDYYGDGSFYRVEKDGIALPGNPQALDEARALCEADYERRVMSCLEVTP